MCQFHRFERTGQVTQHIPQDRISDRVAEQIINFPVHQIPEYSVKVVGKERVPQHTGQQIVDMPVVLQQQAPVIQTEIDRTVQAAKMYRGNENVSMSGFGRLDKNRLAENDEFEAQQEELEEIPADMMTSGQVPAAQIMQKHVKIHRCSPSMR